MLRQIVRSEIGSVQITLYDDEEKRNALSVCEVTSNALFDELNQPIRGGLYDPRMGPLDGRTICETCNIQYAHCPGHPGHIELVVPVYYPMYFPELVRLLKLKCVCCHKLRISSNKVRYFLLKLKLLEMECIEEANQIMELANPSDAFSEDFEDDKERKEEMMYDIEKKLQQYEKRYQTFLQNKAKRSTSSSSSSALPPHRKENNTYVRSLQREVIEGFNKLVQSIKRCENCGGFSPSFRKDGAAKIFQKPLSKKNQKSMAAMKKSFKTAMDVINRKEQGLEVNESDDENLDGNFDDDQTDSEGSVDDANRRNKENNEADKYLAAIEVEAQIKLLWQEHAEFLNFIWTRSLNRMDGSLVIDLKKAEGWKVFFMRAVVVTPNKFRPASIVGDQMSEHPQNLHLKKIIELNSQIRIMKSKGGNSFAGDLDASPNSESNEDGGFQLSKLISAWIDLQNAVNCYMDASKDPNSALPDHNSVGIKQILERKEGLFRRHMMGKRVNFCCRSVISPDPYLGTNEIGIPIRFAKELYYPVPVNDWNVKYLRKLVERGPDQYPGANAIETADGKVIKLEKLSAMERAGRAKLLLSNAGNKVYRHLITGDPLLVNRQPTLHKPGIMAHKARVLEHMREQTLRMNYANCNTYNADFDGDEMNCHYLQSELARAEALHIANTDNQYIIPTSGAPIRGLIQDHVASAVRLTCKDTFLTKDEFQQLVFIAVSGMSGTEIVLPSEDIVLPPPTIYKPKRLWTGKQVISALLSHLCRAPLPPLQLDSKARTPATAFGAEHNEHEVIIRGGELLSGVLDKNAIGNVSLGVVHAVYELYSAELAGKLLNAFGRLFTFYLQDAGHSCGIQDLVLNDQVEKQRNFLLEKLEVEAKKGLEHFLHEDKHSDNAHQSHSAKKEDVTNKLAHFFANDRKSAKVKIDGEMQSVINKSASEVIRVCLPNGLLMPFLNNHFSQMVLTGAKGSAVNQSQISCLLGQQALEGQRVPLMASGKSLPSFKSFDGSARAGGFVRDRFLTGVKPQEYFFHCMAGREGLVDTAVKTSRSGYLQRCLVKSLEELKVNYDMTVRDSGSNIVQFLYGEDGLDPVNAALLGGNANQLLFLARNNQALAYKYSLHAEFFNQGIEMETAQDYHLKLKKMKELKNKAANKFDLSAVTKGSYVMARKKVLNELDWGKDNLQKTWCLAEVLKVKAKESSSSPGKIYFDLKYEDGSVEKKVPSYFWFTPRPTSVESAAYLSRNYSDSTERLPIPLIKISLPDDTPMNHLKLGNAVGACSEKIQDSLLSYIQKNPDQVITSNVTESTITSDALELLVWVKYMRSLACPGEAVGCVAAQSIGEPSTQMTLNTFHLAGHGGGNVTLGIPRLREIIMTGSKLLKTPTMFLPLNPKYPANTMEVAKNLARKLSQLSIIELLDHRRGIEVGEEIIQQSSMSRWERKYRLRLRFQPKEKIEKTFNITFDMLITTIRSTFISKLDWFIKLDQRRAGEGVSGKNDALKQFRSNTSDEKDLRRATRKKSNEDGDDDDEGGNAGGDDDNNKQSIDKQSLDDLFGDDDEDNGNTKNKRKASKTDYNSDEDESSDEESEGKERENNEDLGNLKLSGSGKEMIGYDDDDEEEGEEDGDNNNEDATSDDAMDVDADKKKGSKKKKEGTAKAKTSNKLQVSNENFSFNEAENWIEMTITYPVFNRRLLMAQIAEKAAKETMIRSTKNIKNAYAIEAQHSPCKMLGVSTEGVNFEAIWELPESLIDYNSILSNDIWKILTTYGVEAARSSIVNEIQAVFGVYGINVNTRHLLLIADFMTRNGTYTPMNRIGMRASPSPFLQMSFESTVAFLTRATEEGMVDNHQSPSSSLVFGSVPKIGTGCFDVMLPLEH